MREPPLLCSASNHLIASGGRALVGVGVSVLAAHGSVDHGAEAAGPSPDPVAGVGIFDLESSIAGLIIFKRSMSVKRS